MTKLTSEQINCLKLAGQSFGYRLIDHHMPVFKSLVRAGLVYETVRAFYLTDAGLSFLRHRKANMETVG